MARNLLIVELVMLQKLSFFSVVLFILCSVGRGLRLSGGLNKCCKQTAKD
jgi:hypothetical protein